MRKKWIISAKKRFCVQKQAQNRYFNRLQGFIQIKWKTFLFFESYGFLGLNFAVFLSNCNFQAEEKLEPKDRVMETIEFINDQIYCLGKKQKVKRDLGFSSQNKWVCTLYISHFLRKLTPFCPTFRPSKNDVKKPEENCWSSGRMKKKLPEEVADSLLQFSVIQKNRLIFF